MDLAPVLDPMITQVRDLGQYIRDQRVAARLSLRGLAARAGVSNPYLSQVERGLRRPSADILASIARGLSISVETLLGRAGILPSADQDGSPVLAAIAADVDLSRTQKESLTEIYLAFRATARGGEPIATSASSSDGRQPSSSHPVQPKRS